MPTWAHFDKSLKPLNWLTEWREVAIITEGHFEGEPLATIVERIDHMIMQAEARRNSIIRELDRHRDAVARRLRATISDIEDADFEVVTPDSEKTAA